MYNDQYSPHKFNFLPPVCKNLLIINVLAFFTTYVLKLKGINLEDYLGLHFFMADNHYIWQYITYSFMHANFNHLFFNMFAIWMFGYTLENIWGTKRFIFFCFTAALGAAFVQQITYYFMYGDLVQALSNGVLMVSDGVQRVPIRDFFKSNQHSWSLRNCFWATSCLWYDVSKCQHIPIFSLPNQNQMVCYWLHSIRTI